MKKTVSIMMVLALLQVAICASLVYQFDNEHGDRCVCTEPKPEESRKITITEHDEVSDPTSEEPPTCEIIPESSEPSRKIVSYHSEPVGNPRRPQEVWTPNFNRIVHEGHDPIGMPRTIQYHHTVIPSHSPIVPRRVVSQHY